MNLFKVLPLIIAVVLFSACGSKDKDDKKPEKDAGHKHEHKHGENEPRLVITDSKTNTLTHFDGDEKKFESLGQAASLAGIFIHALNGESAALKTDKGIQFVAAEFEEHNDKKEKKTEEHHEAAPEILNDLTITDTTARVIASLGHYSVLKGGNSHFYPYDKLHSSTKAEEDLTIKGITQTFPAAILDDEDGLMLVFANDKATVYKKGVATADSWDCKKTEQVSQSKELTVFSCEGQTRYVAVHEEAGKEPEIKGGVTLSGFNAKGWSISGDHIVAYNGSTAKSLHLHDDHIDVDDVKLSLAAGSSICTLAATTVDDAIIVLDNKGSIIISKDEKVRTITMPDAKPASLTCNDLNISGYGNGAAITDNDAGKLYVVDAHDGGQYHIHSNSNLSAGTSVKSLAMLHKMKKESGTHKHKH